ncbi:MAG: CADD family putative folate metabolism protein [Candidatus Magasanikbacteria bacterium]|nr:CADD family putative folate metabolism protein [Candidatus Magasanikbacteria bacterium]
MTFVEKLQKLVSEKHLLNHPFYQHWSKGTLPLTVMQRYAEQYYHLEKNFPTFLSRMHSDCNDFTVRQTITDNLYDEEHGELNHRELWQRFGEAVGSSREAIQSSQALPETVAAVACFDELARESFLSGSAALAAYESQIPAISKSKMDGLAKHYNITSERGTEFFRVHSTLDVEHSNAWWDIIEKHATTPELKEKVERAVVAGRDALWNFLDGVCRAYFPEALQMQC